MGTDTRLNLMINAVIFRPIGPEIRTEAEKVSAKTQESSGITFGLIGNRTVGTLAPRVRENSPEFDELQAQIDALR